MALVIAGTLCVQTKQAAENPVLPTAAIVAHMPDLHDGDAAEDDRLLNRPLKFTFIFDSIGELPLGTAD